MMKQKDLVPKKRFAGFTEKWNSKRMEELASFSKGKGYSKRDLVSFGSPIILYGHLYTDYKSYIQTVKTYATKKENSVISQGNEVIVPSSGETAEDIARASAVGISGIILAGDLNIIKPNPTIDSLFLGLNISNNNLQKELIKRVQGSSVVHLYNSDIEEVNLIYPTLKEQQKIGQFFKGLDEMITLEQRKIDKTKALKSSYLAEMFPAEGEHMPKRRFEGFTAEWEEHKLGDISDVTKLAGFEYTKHVIYSDKGITIALRGLNVKNGKIILDDVKYIDQSDFSKLSRSKLFKNDILLTYVGTVGELAIIPEDNKYYLAPNVARIRLEKGINSQFIIQMMGDKTFYNKVISPLIATSSQPALSMENIRKFCLKLPTLEEQKKIGALFKIIDDMIINHQQKLAKLKSTKQAYLHEMFV